MAFGSTPGLTDLGGSANETPNENPEGTEQQEQEGAEQSQEQWDQQVAADSELEQPGQTEQSETPEPPPEEQEQQEEQVTVADFMRDYGLEEKDVVSAMKEYLYLASPEGMEQFKESQREQVEKLVAQRRNDTVKEGLRELLSSPQGQQAIEHALSRARGEQGSGDYETQQNPQMQALMQRLSSLEQQNSQLLEQLGGGKEQQEQLQWQQKWEGEYEGFFKQFPNASRYQKELAQDLRDAIDQNPHAYKRPGAATFKLRSLLAKYNRIAGPAKADAPRVPGRRTGGGGMVSRAHQAPRNQQQLLKSILTDIDSFGGG